MGRKLEQLTVVQLRSELNKRNLNTSGGKNDLLLRLEDAMDKEGQDPSTFSFDVDEEEQMGTGNDMAEMMQLIRQSIKEQKKCMEEQKKIMDELKKSRNEMFNRLEQKMDELTKSIKGQGNSLGQKFDEQKKVMDNFSSWLSSSSCGEEHAEKERHSSNAEVEEKDPRRSDGTRSSGSMDRGSEEGNFSKCDSPIRCMDEDNVSYEDRGRNEDRNRYEERGRNDDRVPNDDRWRNDGRMRYEYRNAIHSSSSEILFGQTVRLPSEARFGSPSTGSKVCSEYLSDLRTRICKTNENTRGRIKLASNWIKRRYDVGEMLSGFKEGDLDWLYHPPRKKDKSPKLQQDGKGSSKVIKHFNNVVYRIQRGDQRKLKVMSVHRLCHYKGEVNEEAVRDEQL